MIWWGIIQMIDWLINWIKVSIGRWLLADQIAAQEELDRDKWKRQQEIIEANYTTDQTADDLDRGEF
jgi:hypothetical protein